MGKEIAQEGEEGNGHFGVGRNIGQLIVPSVLLLFELLNSTFQVKSSKSQAKREEV